MKLLLDTQTLLWPVSEHPQLIRKGMQRLIDPENDLLVSQATYWKLAIEISIGTYRLTYPLAESINDGVR